MKSKSMTRIALAFVLSISLIATGCSAQWISVALADLPVLTQMALNIAALVSTLQSGKQLTASEALAIQNISGEASKDLTLLQALYNAYKASPSADGLQKIESIIQETTRNCRAAASGAHLRSCAFRSNHSRSEPDPDHCEQLRFADSTGLVSVPKMARRTPPFPAQGPETAMESAGLRSQRQRRPGCRTQSEDLAVIIYKKLGTGNRKGGKSWNLQPEITADSPDRPKITNRSQSPVLGSRLVRRVFMTLPVIAITNVSPV